MAFKFRLQNILDLRRKESEELSRQLEILKFREFEVQQQIENERIQYFQDRDDLNQNILKLKFLDISLYEKNLENRQKKLITLLGGLKQIRQDKQDCESSLFSAKKNEKTIEKLKEKNERNDIKDREKNEQKILEEHTLYGLSKESYNEN